MKKILILFCCVCRLAGIAQVFAVDTIKYSGDKNKRINIVFLADGFTAADMPQFLTTANSVTNYLFGGNINTIPFGQYKNYFNVYAVKVISTQSGVSHPGTATDVTEPVIPVSSVNTYFSAQFDYGNIHRLLVATNVTALNAVTAANFPSADQLIVIGNSPEYGGSGGANLAMSMNPNSSEIAAHEMGHSFAGLADEYWAGLQYAIEKPNLTAEPNPANVKWNYWVNQNGIGVYPHGTSSPESGWFRPHQNCKMRYLGSPYCSVCKQAIIESIHSRTNPIDSFSPGNTSIMALVPGNTVFKTKLLLPIPNTLKSTWKLNGYPLPNQADTLSMADWNFIAGNNSVQATVIDTNTLSKDPMHPINHQFSVLWTVNKSFVGINTLENIFQLSTFPNPSSSILTLRYHLEKTAEIRMEIMDLQGKSVSKLNWGQQAGGDHEQQVDISALTTGTYFINCSIDKQTIIHQIIISR